MKVVLDNTILVRANENSQGLARDLLITIVENEHTLLLSNELLHELARVLRYPRLLKFYADRDCRRSGRTLHNGRRFF